MGFKLFVNGTLMRGLELHKNMRDSKFLGEFRTGPFYRLHSINNTHPGMYRVENNETGFAVLGELYLVEKETWSIIEAGEPSGLYRGKITLEDGSEVYGILYPRKFAEMHPDISTFGGWRTYVIRKQAQRSQQESEQM